MLKIAAEGALAGLAIADHDTIDAHEELGQAGTQSNEPWLLVAIEFSTSREGEEIHILGYFPRGLSADVRELAEAALERRSVRLRGGLRQLRERGVDISLRDCTAIAQGRSISRAHIADVLVAKGYVGTPRQAYSHLLRGGVFPGSTASPEEIVRQVGDIGGISVWAHPRRDQLERHLDALTAAGIEGLEARTPWRKPAEIRKIERLAAERSLVVTAGSDWHRETRRGPKLGRFGASETQVEAFLALVRERSSSFPV